MELDPAPLKQLEKRLRYIVILGRSDLRKHLYDLHLGAERAIHTGELESDVITTDDDDGRRDIRRAERVVGVVDPVTVGRHERKVARIRPGREQDALRPRQRSLSVRSLHRDRLRVRQPPLALDDLDPVALDEPGEPLVHTPHHRLFEVENLPPVHLRLLRDDPELSRRLDLVHQIGGVQQSLRWDAPAVEARPADLVPFDHRHGQPQLYGAEGGGITTVPASQDDEIEGVRTVGHEEPPREK